MVVSTSDPIVAYGSSGIPISQSQIPTMERLGLIDKLIFIKPVTSARNVPSFGTVRAGGGGVISVGGRFGTKTLTRAATDKLRAEARQVGVGTSTKDGKTFISGVTQKGREFAIKKGLPYVDARGNVTKQVGNQKFIQRGDVFTPETVFRIPEATKVSARAIDPNLKVLKDKEGVQFIITRSKQAFDKLKEAGLKVKLEERIGDTLKLTTQPLSAENQSKLLKTNYPGKVSLATSAPTNTEVATIFKQEGLAFNQKTVDYYKKEVARGKERPDIFIVEIDGKQTAFDPNDKRLNTFGFMTATQQFEEKRARLRGEVEEARFKKSAQKAIKDSRGLASITAVVEDPVNIARTLIIAGAGVYKGRKLGTINKELTEQILEPSLAKVIREREEKTDIDFIKDLAERSLPGQMAQTIALGAGAGRLVGIAAKAAPVVKLAAVAPKVTTAAKVGAAVGFTGLFVAEKGTEYIALKAAKAPPREIAAVMGTGFFKDAVLLSAFGQQFKRARPPMKELKAIQKPLKRVLKPPAKKIVKVTKPVKVKVRKVVRKLSVKKGKGTFTEDIRIDGKKVGIRKTTIKFDKTGKIKSGEIKDIRTLRKGVKAIETTKIKDGKIAKLKVKKSIKTRLSSIKKKLKRKLPTKERAKLLRRKAGLEKEALKDLTTKASKIAKEKQLSQFEKSLQKFKNDPRIQQINVNQQGGIDIRIQGAKADTSFNSVTEFKKWRISQGIRKKPIKSSEIARIIAKARAEPKAFSIKDPKTGAIYQYSVDTKGKAVLQRVLAPKKGGGFRVTAERGTKLNIGKKVYKGTPDEIIKGITVKPKPKIKPTQPTTQKLIKAGKGTVQIQKVITKVKVKKPIVKKLIKLKPPKKPTALTVAAVAQPGKLAISGKVASQIIAASLFAGKQKEATITKLKQKQQQKLKLALLQKLAKAQAEKEKAAEITKISQLTLPKVATAQALKPAQLLATAGVITAATILKPAILGFPIPKGGDGDFYFAEPTKKKELVTKYKPSLAALELNITAAKMPGVITGVGIRPLLVPPSKAPKKRVKKVLRVKKRKPKKLKRKVKKKIKKKAKKKRKPTLDELIL